MLSEELPNQQFVRRLSLSEYPFNYYPGSFSFVLA
jgi:hypothetical protein